jgi:hypothetical protein
VSQACAPRSHSRFLLRARALFLALAVMKGREIIPVSVRGCLLPRCAVPIYAGFSVPARAGGGFQLPCRGSRSVKLRLQGFGSPAADINPGS